MSIKLVLLLSALILNIDGHAQIGVFDNSDINGDACFNCSEDLQKLLPRILPEYFLLGSLGPRYLLKTDSSLDYYFPAERHKMSDLKGIINTIANDIRIDTIKGFIYSDRQIPIRRKYIKDGILIDSLFTTGEQIYSYLLGVCWRYGEKLSESVFFFRFVDENKIIFPLLRRIECNKIYYEYLSERRYVPNMTLIYFRSTPILTKYFASVNIQNTPSKEAEKFEKIFEDIHN